MRSPPPPQRCASSSRTRCSLGSTDKRRREPGFQCSGIDQPAGPAPMHRSSENIGTIAAALAKAQLEGVAAAVMAKPAAACGGASSRHSPLLRPRASSPPSSLPSVSRGTIFPLILRFRGLLRPNGKPGFANVVRPSGSLMSSASWPTPTQEACVDQAADFLKRIQGGRLASPPKVRAPRQSAGGTEHKRLSSSAMRECGSRLRGSAGSFRELIAVLRLQRDHVLGHAAEICVINGGGASQIQPHARRIKLTRSSFCLHRHAFMNLASFVAL